MRKKILKPLSSFQPKERSNSSRHFELSNSINKLFRITQNSDYFEYLVDNGVDELELIKFIDSKHLKKTEFDSSISIKHAVDELLNLGGEIAGGFAVHYLFGIKNHGDIDIFFNDDVLFAKATLFTRNVRGVDVCRYFNVPFEFFDLALTQCSFNKNEFNIDENCIKAYETGVSDIIPENIINVNATFKRIIKYHNRTGVKFKPEQILTICAIFNTPKAMIDELMLTCK